MSDNDGFFVKMQRNVYNSCVDIVIGQRGRSTTSIVKPIQMVFEEIKDNYQIVEPSLRLTHWVAEPFLKAFADMLHQENIKPTTQSFIEGELIATKKHLEDMRKLMRIKP